MQRVQDNLELSAYPEASRAVLSLVLGILGLFIAVFAPFAWLVASRELVAIDEARRPPAGRGFAIAGRVLGIIGTVFLVLMFIGFAFLVQVRTG